MRFWSKGLGKLTVDLHLDKGTTVRSSGMLYLQGRMEAPVDWEYIMPLDEEDIVDFMTLLRDPALAAYVNANPNKWRIYGGMISGGLRLVAAIGREVWRGIGAEAEAEVGPIQVPPPVERKKNTKRPARRRLGTKTLSAPGRATGTEGSPEAANG